MPPPGEVQEAESAGVLPLQTVERRVGSWWSPSFISFSVGDGGVWASGGGQFTKNEACGSGQGSPLSGAFAMQSCSAFDSKTTTYVKHI